MRTYSIVRLDKNIPLYDIRRNYNPHQYYLVQYHQSVLYNVHNMNYSCAESEYTVGSAVDTVVAVDVTGRVDLPSVVGIKWVRRAP